MNIGKVDWDFLEATEFPSLEILVDSSSLPNEATSQTLASEHREKGLLE